MPTPLLLTYRDAIDAATDFLSGHSESAAQRDIRRAVQIAYREVMQAREWRCLMKQGRVQFRAPYSTGTVTYTHTGGSVERQLVLASGTWPTNCKDWVVKIGDAEHHIDSRVNDTYVSLDATLNPGSDASISGDSYKCYPSYYALPADLRSLKGVWGEASWRLGREVSADAILAMNRFQDNTGDISYYAVREVGDTYGTMGLYVHPVIDAAGTCDFIYQRQGRDLRYAGMTADVDYADDGTISVSGTAVTGSSTAFNSKMVGSLLRIGDSSNLPTGLDGLYPYAEELTISAVGSSTGITLTSSADSAHTNVKYVITDIVDLHRVLHNAFFACLYKTLATVRNMKAKAEYVALYRDALFQAKSADALTTQSQIAGQHRHFGYRLADTSPAADQD